MADFCDLFCFSKLVLVHFRNDFEPLLHKFTGNLGARLWMKSCRGFIDAMTVKIDLRTSAIYHSRGPNQPNLPNWKDLLLRWGLWSLLSRSLQRSRVMIQYHMEKGLNLLPSIWLAAIALWHNRVHLAAMRLCITAVRHLLCSSMLSILLGME